MLRAFRAALVTFAGALFLAAACGSPETRTGTKSPSNPDGSFADGGIGEGGPLDRPGAKCDGSLRNVVDESGAVVQECPPDQGCAGAKCVPACQAASEAKGSLGCSFVVSTPAFIAGITQPCFAMFVANSWSKDIQIDVKRGGASLGVRKFARIPDGTGNVAAWQPLPMTGLPPSNVAVIFLSADPGSTHPIGGSMACPVAPGVNAATAVNGTGKGQAFEITTDLPVTAYDIHPFGGAPSFLPSAQLILPTTAWGTNFVAVTPLANDPLTFWGQVIAATDGTTIDVVPTMALPGGGGLAGAPANTKTTFTLNAGEFIEWQPNGEFAGSVLSSNHPIAFVGGAAQTCLSSSTSSGGGCDSTHQLVPPVNALGNEYAVASYLTRRLDLQDEAVLHRIVGVVDGTTLKYEPAVSGAPTTLAKGEVTQFEAKGGFVVKSQDDQHPFYVGQAMTGCQVTGGSRAGITVPAPFGMDNCLGDEEYVVVLPPAQYLSKYVFFTDSTYGTTNLVITRRKVSGGAGFKPVTVDCLGEVTGWSPLGTTGDYEQTTIDLVRGGASNGSCTNGGHTAESEAPFGVTVWGLDVYASYAYPAGGNVSSINTVYVPPVPK